MTLNSTRIEGLAVDSANNSITIYLATDDGRILKIQPEYVTIGCHDDSDVINYFITEFYGNNKRRRNSNYSEQVLS